VSTGLTRDKTRKPGKQPLPATVVQRVVDLTLGPPPGDATHWTGRMLAKAAGVSLRLVQRILEAHRLAPHPVRTFRLSTDPKFTAKLKDIVGLYVAGHRDVLQAMPPLSILHSRPTASAKRGWRPRSTYLPC